MPARQLSLCQYTLSCHPGTTMARTAKLCMHLRLAQAHAYTCECAYTHTQTHTHTHTHTPSTCLRTVFAWIYVHSCLLCIFSCYFSFVSANLLFILCSWRIVHLLVIYSVLCNFWPFLCLQAIDTVGCHWHLRIRALTNTVTTAHLAMGNQVGMVVVEPVGRHHRVVVTIAPDVVLARPVLAVHQLWIRQKLLRRKPPRCLRRRVMAWREISLVGTAGRFVSLMESVSSNNNNNSSPIVFYSWTLMCWNV